MVTYHILKHFLKLLVHILYKFNKNIKLPLTLAVDLERGKQHIEGKREDIEG